MTNSGERTSTPARRGRPPRIDRSKILEAASSILPESLTVQAVADQLGVDRKAVSYYVRDREGLLQLVAVDAFRSELERVRIDPGDDWRQAVRSLAAAMRDSFAATGTLVHHYRFETEDDLRVLEPVETVLRTVLRAGFDPKTAGHAFTFLANLAMSFARDAVLTSRHGHHPQSSEVRRAVQRASPAEYGAVRRIIEARVDSGGDEQFDFDVHVFVLGMERLLERGPSTDGG